MNAAVRQDGGGKMSVLESRFNQAHEQKRQLITGWLQAKRAGDDARAAEARAAALAAHERSEAVRAEARDALQTATHTAKASDSDYVFITFILRHLPHGLIGLLVSAFFAATLSSKAAELNALASTTVVDLYRHVVQQGAGDAHYVSASRWFTAFWGVVAIAFALFANLVENLIQAVNIVGSIFYGVVLGMFLVAFFLRRVGGTAIFWAAIGSQLLVLVLYFSLSISYLWYNVIGCAACVVVGVLLQWVLRTPGGRAELQSGS